MISETVYGLPATGERDNWTTVEFAGSSTIGVFGDGEALLSRLGVGDIVRVLPVDVAVDDVALRGRGEQRIAAVVVVVVARARDEGLHAEISLRYLYMPPK